MTLRTTRPRPFFAVLFALAVPRHAQAEEPPSSPPLPAAPPVVTIDSTRPLTVVERRANEIRGWNLSFPPAYVATEQWEPVCVAPCATPLDPNGVYRVGGGGVAPSGFFVLPRTNPVHLHVHAGSRFWHGAGLAGFILGGAAVLTGGIIAGSGSGSDARQNAISGAEIAGSGLALLAAGLIVWLTTASTVVTDDGHPL